jgi:hypothetical protein
MTAGRSRSAIHSTDPGWYFSSDPRHPRHRRPRRHRGVRRARRCGPRRRNPPLRLADPADRDGRPPLHRHPGRISRNDRRLRPRPSCRRRHLIASVRRRRQPNRHRPPRTSTGRPRSPNRRRRGRPRSPGRRPRNRHRPRSPGRRPRNRHRPRSPGRRPRNRHRPRSPGRRQCNRRRLCNRRRNISLRLCQPGLWACANGLGSSTR